METRQKEGIKSFFRGDLRFGTYLKEFTSFRVGGPAEVLAFPRDREDLKNLWFFLKKEKIPALVLGEGTNLLVRDGGYNGVVINLTATGPEPELLEVPGERFNLRVAAGERLSRMVEFCRNNSLTGLEFASGIPGSVGGAIAMNAGAFGGEMQTVVSSLDILDDSGKEWALDRQVLTFSYRRLALPSGSIIVEAVLGLRRGNQAEISERIRAILQKRKASQPLEYPSAGSVFKNPPGQASAGQLIEELGLKGFQIGGAAVSPRHANWIVNLGSATARDILNLMTLIQDRVEQAKGIRLEPEIQVVGED